MGDGRRRRVFGWKVAGCGCGLRERGGAAAVRKIRIRIKIKIKNRIKRREAFFFESFAVLAAGKIFRQFRARWRVSNCKLRIEN